MCARRCTFVDANERRARLPSRRVIRIAPPGAPVPRRARRVSPARPARPRAPLRRSAPGMRVGAVARALVPSPRAAAREDPRVRARAPAHRHHPRPPRALPPSDVVADASAAALGAVAGAGLVALAWPIARRELRPIRCATCRGMSWTICDRCRGRGKTGCPPLVAAVDEYAAAAAAEADDEPADAADAATREKPPSPAPAGSNPALLPARDPPSPLGREALSYCRRCGGRGRVRCAPCAGTGVENNWLYGPAANPGWGPRGEWRDPAKPPRWKPPRDE